MAARSRAAAALSGARGPASAPGRLARRAARGDRDAFEEVFRRYHQELYRYCLAIVRDREDAEDALQATMAAALRSLPGEERDIALRPWLYRVAHNESISLLRSRGPVGTGEEPVGTAGSAAAELEGRDRLRQLVSDLQALPDRQRSAIVMRELSDLSYEEIGAALGCAQGAARQTVHEARTALFAFQEGRDMECESVREAISAGDGRRLRARKVRAHLRTCDACLGFEASITQRRSDLRALCPPLPALAASGLLAGLLGGSGGAAGAAGAAAAGAGVSGAGAGLLGSGLAGSAAIKGASLVAAAAVAAGAADLGGVIDLPNPVGGDSEPAAREGGGSAGSGGGANVESVPAGDPAAAGVGDASTGDSAQGSGDEGRSSSQTGDGNSSKPGAAGSQGNSSSAPGQSASPGKSESAPGRSSGAPSSSTHKQSGNGGSSASAPGQTKSGTGKQSAPGQTKSGTGSAAAPGQVKGSGGNSAKAETPPKPPPTKPKPEPKPKKPESVVEDVKPPKLPPLEAPTGSKPAKVK